MRIRWFRDSTQVMRFFFNACVGCYGLKVHSILWKTFLSHPILKDWLRFFCIPTGEPEFWNHLPISLANIQNCIHLQKQFDISILIIFTIYAYNMLLTCTIYIDLYPPNWYYNLIEFLSKKKQNPKSTVLIFPVGGIGKRWCTHDNSTTFPRSTGGQRSL